MSDEKKSRPLTEKERHVIELVHTWNRLTDTGCHIGTLTMSHKGADSLTRHGIARPFKMESVDDKSLDQVRLYFTTKELENYLYFACKQVGFTLLLNGGVRTEDGLFVEPNPVTLKPTQVFS